MARNSIHVTHSKQGEWNVRKAGASRASAHFDTKDKAVKGIRDIGKKIIDAKDNAKEFVTGKLQQGIKNATNKLQDFADADGR